MWHKTQKSAKGEVRKNDEKAQLRAPAELKRGRICGDPEQKKKKIVRKATRAGIMGGARKKNKKLRYHCQAERRMHGGKG